MHRIFLPLLLLVWSCDPAPVAIEEPSGFTCNQGFNTDKINETCTCPEGLARIGTIDCRALEAGEYYATMDNCVVDAGMIIKFGDSLQRLSETESLFAIYVEKPDSIFSYTFANNTGRMFHLPHGRDSMVWNVGTEHYLTVVEEYSYGIAPWFEGIVINQDTISGRFRWGAQGG